MMDAKTYQRQIQGARSKANGRMFEDIVINSCHRYFADRKAIIHKENEPMKPIRDLGQGKFVACYERKSQPDFKGKIMDGPMVLFEAKHTDADRLKYEAVTQGQARAFDYHTEFGVECFVLISFGFRKFYKVPWNIYRKMKDIYGRKYIKPEDLTKYEIPFVGGILKFLG